MKINRAFDFWVKWNKLGFTGVISIEARNDKFQIEFKVDESFFVARDFVSSLKKASIEKHPTGNFSWIGYSGNSQYKVYRIEFVDPSIKEKSIESEKLELFLSKLQESIDHARKIHRSSHAGQIQEIFSKQDQGSQSG